MKRKNEGKGGRGAREVSNCLLYYWTISDPNLKPSDELSDGFLKTISNPAFIQNISTKLIQMKTIECYYSIFL